MAAAAEGVVVLAAFLVLVVVAGAVVAGGEVFFRLLLPVAAMVASCGWAGGWMDGGEARAAEMVSDEWRGIRHKIVDLFLV